MNSFRKRVKKELTRFDLIEADASNNAISSLERFREEKVCSIAYIKQMLR